MKVLEKLVSRPRIVVFLVLATFMLLLNVTTGIAPPDGGTGVP